MSSLTALELEELANEAALELDAITEEQAENSDFGGDSDAEDNPKYVSRITVSTVSTPTFSLSDPSRPSSVEPSSCNAEATSSVVAEVTSTSTPKLSRRSSRLIPKEKRRKSTDNFSDETSEDEPISDDSEENVILADHITAESADSDNEEETQNDIANPENYPIWTKNAEDPTEFSNSSFRQPFGPGTAIYSLETPIKFFSLFITPCLIAEIVKQSNLYATQLKQQLNLETNEFSAFLGILIFMGFHYLPSMRLYWSIDENFHCERIARVMSLKRFLKILRHIHLADNEKMPKKGSPDFDKLYKIRPLIEHLERKFKEHFCPSRFISVDESMVGFKGRSSMKQYMPMKPIKRGFKIWVMCCAVTGYMLTFDVYTGKDTSAGIQTGNLGLGERVVLKLSQALEGLYYCLFFDNFFSSVPLMLKLLQKKIFACGTVRINKKYLPLHKMKSNREMKRNDIDFAMHGDLSFVKWVDRGKKPVTVLSTLHNPSESTLVKRTNKKGEREEVNCPQAIADYNRYMGGVDRFDQMQATYNIARKSRRWWVKLFYYFVDSAIVNSYILYKEVMKSKKQKCLSQLNFRSKLVNELIGDFTSKSKPGYQPMHGYARKKNNKLTTVENVVRHTGVGIHLPKVIGTYRRCKLCSTKKKEKRSNIICETCNAALCKACFADFHKK